MKCMFGKLGFAALVFGCSAVCFGQKLEQPPEPPRIQTGEVAKVQRQAGIGSEVAFSRAGVLELGGSLSATSSENYQELGVTPQIGYFFADNMQISALASANYVAVKTEEESQEQSVSTIIVEPSVHLPLNVNQFVFAGLGLGALLRSGGSDGFAIAPRVGFKNLVGRSGMLTASIQPVFGINESEVQTFKGTVLTVSQAYTLALGYTVLL